MTRSTGSILKADAAGDAVLEAALAPESDPVQASSLEQTGRVTAQLFASARQAQAKWALLDVRERLQVISRFRQLLVDRHLEAINSVTGPHRKSPAETIAAEIMPLCDAAAFLEKRAARILATRKLGAVGRPAWLFGVSAQVRREPIGLVLVIGPFNYPLLLTGVPLLQALVAGNAVVLKPGRWGLDAARFLKQTLAVAGLPSELIVVLDESVDAVQRSIDVGVDKVVFTGSANTGSRVLEMLAPSGTPAVMELSGSDPLIVLPGADLDRVARAVGFGLGFNSSATCIAPRRLIVHRSLMLPLENKLNAVISRTPPSWVDPRVSAKLARLIDTARNDGARVMIGDGSRPLGASPLLVVEPAVGSPILREDLFAPVATVLAFDTTDQAVELANDCPYALGASVFGPEHVAREVAVKVNAGSVVINDIIAPTADPRLAFTGRKKSGFGATRGEEGLLEMTVIKNISVRKRGMLAHLEPAHPADAERLSRLLELLHRPGMIAKCKALIGLIKAEQKAKATDGAHNHTNDTSAGHPVGSQAGHPTNPHATQATVKNTEDYR